MTGTDFNTATSIYFVGYIIMQVPSNLVLTRVRPSYYLATAALVWGVISASQAACKTYSGLVVARLFLGFAEAPVFPGCLFLMSSWYTRREVRLLLPVLVEHLLIILVGAPLRMVLCWTTVGERFWRPNRRRYTCRHQWESRDCWLVSHFGAQSTQRNK